jgi:hypothetical protein
VRPMAALLDSGKLDPDARALALRNRAAESPDQRFDVCEDDRSKGGSGKDRGERFAMPCIHMKTIA